MEFLPVAPDHDALDCRLPSRQTAPVVVASPHSGSIYPAAFLAQAAVSLAALRRAEDAFVDELFSAAPALGIPFLAALFPRSFVDANREPYELDPAMFCSVWLDSSMSSFFHFSSFWRKYSCCIGFMKLSRSVGR